MSIFLSQDKIVNQNTHNLHDKERFFRKKEKGNKSVELKHYTGRDFLRRHFDCYYTNSEEFIDHHKKKRNKNTLMRE